MAETNKAPLVSGKFLFSTAGLGVMLAIVVMINVLFAGINLRWDATEDKLFSLSDGSREILGNLKENVTLKICYTQDVDDVPVHIKNYAKRMLDFLGEYETVSKGKVKVVVFNPKPDSEEEEWAHKYGIEGAGLPNGDKVYFGLVALAADQEQTIPMLDPAREEQLEYDITRLISRVQSAKKKKIGIISGLPIFGQPPAGFMQQPQRSQPWLFIEELKKTYDVSQISPTESQIPKDTDLLLVIHPRDFSEGMQYAIDQHVLAGGNLIVLADPVALADPAGGRGPAPENSLKKLFEAWGIEMDMNKVVTDMDYPTRLRNQSNQVEDNPMWISIKKGASDKGTDKGGFNTEDIITGQLENMLFPLAGAVKKAASSTYKYESMVSSSKNAALTDALMARFGGGEFLRKDFKATSETYDLAARITGKFKTAFPGGKPKDKEKKEGQDIPPEKEAPKSDAAHIAEGQKETTVIVVADTDLLQDDFYVRNQNFLGFKISQMFNDNLNFLLNAGEMLTGDKALIGIRSRGKFERPFTRVQELEKKAQSRWLAREQELMSKAEDTNRKLSQLEKQKDASQKLLISPEQEKEIRNFQEEKIRVNKELKEVRRNLRADIETLGTTLKFINIFLMVFVVAGVGSMYALHQRRKMRT